MNEWLTALFNNKDLLKMGHCQRRDDLNLGMGWIYYGLTRLVRNSSVVVIGSWRGFAPLVFGKALADNLEKGTVTFIDPSLVDDFWKDEAHVRDHFTRYGVTNISHHRMTTQEFVTTETYRALRDIGIVMVDGYHTAEQARIDCEAFLPLLAPDGIMLFHDSCLMETTEVYGADRPYRRTVKLYLDELKKDPALQVFDLPFAKGLTLVRKSPPPARDE